MKKQFLVTCSVLLLSACTSSTISHNDYRHQGINFGSDRDADFRKGVRDACRTIGCDYTKDHNKLKNSESYRLGWEEGQLKCKGKGNQTQGF
jgi:major membrane immunogen (membrane-anchored lipoprotein)